MIAVTVFEPNEISIWFKNCHHDHIPFIVKGNWNIVFSVYISLGDALQCSNDSMYFRTKDHQKQCIQVRFVDRVYNLSMILMSCETFQWHCLSNFVCQVLPRLLQRKTGKKTGKTTAIERLACLGSHVCPIEGTHWNPSDHLITTVLRSLSGANERPAIMPRDASLSDNGYNILQFGCRDKSSYLKIAPAHIWSLF